MKIAVVTDDGKTISQHFGRAKYYQVFEVQNGAIKGIDRRPKVGHHVEGENHHAEHVEAHEHHGDPAIHNAMLANIADCKVLIARGMGYGAFEAIKEAGLEPFITDIESTEEAVKAYINGKLDSHTERLH